MLRNSGYSDRTRYRSAVRELLVTLEETLLSPWPGLELTQRSELVNAVRGLALRVNTGNSNDLSARVHALEVQCLEQEAARDAVFAAVKAAAAAAASEYAAAAGEVPWSRGLRDEVGEAKSSLMLKVRRSRRKLAQSAPPQPAAAAAAAAAGAARRRPPLEAVGATLAALGRLRIARDNAESVVAQYRKALIARANAGDHSGALRLFRDMSVRGLSPDLRVFLQLITACKNATPVASERAVEVLDQLTSQGLDLGVEVFNAVLDVCRLAGHWRRGLMVFNKMSRHEQAVPNTHTYSLLVASGARSNDDPTEVYSAMKFAGVPEYIAYSAAAGRASRFDDSVERVNKKKVVEEEGPAIGLLAMARLKKRAQAAQWSSASKAAIDEGAANGHLGAFMR